MRRNLCAAARVLLRDRRGRSTQGALHGCGILAEGQVAASHFSCIGATRAGDRAQLAQLKAMGVKRLVALRGDMPSGYGMGGEFQYASDLVVFIRAETGDDFAIEVAASRDPSAGQVAETDLKAFCDQVKAGADSAITQYFYNADAYFRFVDEARRLGVAIPVVPVSCRSRSSAQLLRFSDACGAEVPRWIRLRLQGYGDDSDRSRPSASTL